MNKTITTTMATALFLAACNNTETRETFDPMQLERIDLAVGKHTPGDTSDLNALQPGLGIYLAMMTPDSLLQELSPDSAVARLSELPVTTIFGHDISERFTAADSLAVPLGQAIGRIERLLPAISVSHIYGIASPYMQSVVVSDSVVLVALNHYLGADYPGYASMPAYLTRFKTPGRIVPDVAEALVRVNYPFVPADGTLLERMLYEGAVIRAVAEACGTDDATAAGLTHDDFAAVKKAEHDLWGALASEKLLYAPEESHAGRLLGPSGRVTVGSITLPGRALRVTSLGIIDSYMSANDSADLPTILTPRFYNTPRERLIESRYNP